MSHDQEVQKAMHAYMAKMHHMQQGMMMGGQGGMPMGR